MKRIRIMGLCLVAVFAMTAVAASSASAAPTYKTCVKVVKEGKFYHGKYSTKTCATEATSKEQEEGKKNKYERAAWNAGKEKEPKFKDANGASALLLYFKGVGIVGSTECAKAKGEGHITSENGGNVVVVFEKCTSSGEVCASAGETAGKIKTNLLTTELAELEGKAIQRVGKEGVESASFTCGKDHIRTTGAADAVITGDVGTAVKDSTQSFTTNAQGEQENTVDGDVLVTEVTGVGTFNSGESTTATIKGEEMMVEL